jgi:MauM/NapG family ferredoxin protein
MRFQRLLQIPLFLLFFLLLFLAAYPLPSWPDVDLFLRLDPLISLGTMAAARAFIPRVLWGISFLAAALLMGRIFCAYVCPMGATIDFTDWLFRGRRRAHRRRSKDSPLDRFKGVKYHLLLFTAGTALVGISSVFLFSPLSLITRFYSFVILPLATMVSNLFLDALRPVFPMVGLERLSYVRLSVPTFDTNLFVALLLAGVLLMGLFQSRFWCRNLCPAGALFGLFSRKPLFSRSVSARCTGCGSCARSCPMGAIGENFKTATPSECITCLKCRDVCPEKAISFGIHKREIHSSPDLGRRKLLIAGFTGATTAALTMSGLAHLHGGENPRAIRSSTLIRPPGALPEPAFQARCVRCGECMKACLTNTLQPVWFKSGISGLWTPAVTARLAGCEQNCNLCGRVCPTGAIRPLPLEEKKFAKIGTARIIPSRCIAWEQNKKCLICDEICPYNAISSQFVSGRSVTVPVVDEDRCNGCGYCEEKCPIAGESAVVVEPQGELRLERGSYEERARQMGLVFHARETVPDHFILEGPKGVEEAPLPPGFLPEER